MFGRTVKAVSPLLKHREQTPEETSILEVARNVALQLDIPNLTLNSVLFLEYTSAGRSVQPVPSDQPLLGPGHSLLLAKCMMGMLTTDEWKPLIASALIFSRKLKPSLRRKALSNVALPVILVGVAEVVALQFFPNQAYRGSLLAIGFTIPSLVLLFAGMKRYYPMVRKARLQADLEATSLVSMDSFLAVLRKIDGFGMKDVERWKKETRGFASSLADHPSIAERIENLQSGSARSL